MATNLNGVMFQFFHWFLKKDAPVLSGKTLWKFLEDEGNRLHRTLATLTKIALVSSH